MLRNTLQIIQGMFIILFIVGIATGNHKGLPEAILTTAMFVGVLEFFVRLLTPIAKPTQTETIDPMPKITTTESEVELKDLMPTLTRAETLKKRQEFSEFLDTIARNRAEGLYDSEPIHEEAQEELSDYADAKHKFEKTIESLSYFIQRGTDANDNTIQDSDAYHYAGLVRCFEDLSNHYGDEIATDVMGGSYHARNRSRSRGHGLPCYALQDHANPGYC